MRQSNNKVSQGEKYKYMNSTIETTNIKDLLVITRPRFPDNRGSFQELGRLSEIEEAIGRPTAIRQVSIAETFYKGFRGMHAEEQDKLIAPITGKIFSALVDIRADSPTFKQVFTIEIDTTDNTQPRKAIFIPEGVANSLVTVSEEKVIYLYAISKEYNPNLKKRQFVGNDPDLNIQWPIPWEEMIISDIDRNNPTLKEIL